MKDTAFIIFFLFAINTSYSQENSGISTSPSNNAGLHPKTFVFAQEVYRDCSEYLQEQYLPEYSLKISQVHVLSIPNNGTVDFPLLSTVALQNKCNTDLQRDELNFDPSNFNPLKYFFNYFVQADVYYKVDNQPYVIYISHR